MAKYFDTDGAVAYLLEVHGVKRTKGVMRKMRVQGGGPAFFKMGNAVSYSDAKLDEWVASRKTMHTSTATYPPGSSWRRPGAHLSLRPAEEKELPANDAT